MKRFLIFSGLPASGKSLLGRRVATELKLPLFDKDNFLESLFNTNSRYESESRYQLSRKADELFKQSALSTKYAILISWWKHPDSTEGTGTAVDWLRPYSNSCLEIYCKCSPFTASTRFTNRTRHPDHQDRLRNFSQQLSFSQRQASLGPLNICEGIEVDCESEININKLRTEISKHWQLA